MGKRRKTFIVLSTPDCVRPEDSYNAMKQFSDKLKEAGVDADLIHVYGSLAKVSSFSVPVKRRKKKKK